jgi:hypothetical protein
MQEIILIVLGAVNTFILWGILKQLKLMNDRTKMSDDVLKLFKGIKEIDIDK